ncbi:MAG: hypothetical protein N2Z80_05980 [Hydrogenothermaceae bacterium]|nr:hypothetical protein [Hydrogenothermaceae bacterium]
MLYKRSTVLFISPRLPYPPVGGDRLKNYWLLKILTKHFDVHLVSLTDTDVPVEFYKFAEENGFSCRIFKKNKLSYYANAFKGIFSNKPIQINYYFFKDVKAYINSIISKFDLIITSLIRTSEYVINIDKPKILIMTDSIALHYKNAINKTNSKFWKILYKLESDRLISYEKKCIELFDKTLFVNKKEMEFFNEPSKTIWNPNGVEDILFSYEKYNPEYKNYITFFGKMDYQPNIDAVLWFIKNVLPILDKDIKFCIVGAYPPKMLLNMQKKT